MNLLIAVLAIGAIIFLHELGHYLVARLCHIKVEEFAIGMGPKMVGFSKGETEYNIRWIPFGGYVKMEGEEEEGSSDRSFDKKPAWQRFLVIVAGAFMNFLLGVILIFGLSATARYFPDMTIVKFNDDSVSRESGLQEGDRILEINNCKLRVATDIDYALQSILGDQIDILIERNGETILLMDVELPYVEDEESGLKLNYFDFEIGKKEKTAIGALKYGCYEFASQVRNTYGSLKLLILGKLKLKMMAGPVQIAKVASDALAYNIRAFIRLVSFITINLGFFNLLPLPALDGGKAVLLIAEMITRKRIKPEIEGYIHLVGFAILILFGIMIFYNDILRLFGR